jgi:putative membrane-bound dehydrogenase-like protein
MTRFAVLLVSAAITAAAAAAGPVPPTFQAAPGFVVELVAGKEQVVFPMFGAFDERGRLFVAESSGLDLYAEIRAATRMCRVKLLEDKDGDGRFETSRVFADQLVFPMGLVWHNGALFVADPPDVVTFEDADDDGRADTRKVILSGFGHTDNGSLHGLTFGPDGMLYLTMGTPDGYRLKRDDGTFVEGRSGALLRCQADGSGVEVVCRGFVNLVEVAFTGGGEMIGTDNWYQQPAGGVRDALVHLVEAGLYPYEPDVGTPQPVTGEPLPALALFPAVALSGLAVYRGDVFPLAMRGNLFTAQHNSRKVGRHALSRVGSSFTSEDFDFISSDDPDFHPSDVLEDADGSMLVVDTGGWYVQHCPTGRIRDSRAPGGIYRVRYASTKAPSDPWGLKESWDRISVQRLIQLLDDVRPAVRDRAQRDLISNGTRAIRPLASVLENPASRLIAKLGAVWALAAIPSDDSLAPLRKALRNGNPDVVIAAARSLALRRDSSSGPELRRLLTAENSFERRAAAEALAWCGNSHSLSELWEALGAQPDRFLEHTLIYAAHRIADVPALHAALENENPRVQKAALLLLDQAAPSRGALSPEQVLPRVTATDGDLRQTALRILQSHPGWVQQASTLLERWLAQPELTVENQAGLRGLLLAFQNDAVVQRLTGAAIASDRSSVALRHLLLETVAQCTVTNLPPWWLDALTRAIESPVTRQRAVQTVALLQVPPLDGRLTRLAEDASEPADLRVEALRATVARHPKLSATAFALLMQQLGAQTNPVARLAASEVLRRSQLTDTQTLGALKAIQGDVLISPGALLTAFRDSTSAEATGRLVNYLANLRPESWRPNRQELNTLLDRWPTDAREKAAVLLERFGQPDDAARDRLARFERLLAGGNLERGRAVFFGGKVACSTCHSIGNVGGKVGPDLTKVGAIRSGRDILESILVPSASFAQGYESYGVLTGDGEELSGIVVGQTADTILVRSASGADVQLRRAQIQEMSRLSTSTMPEGLEQGMTPEEFRNLLAFLQSLR